MHARRPDFVSERQTVLDLAALPDARVPKRHDGANPSERPPGTAGEPKPRRNPRWPAAAPTGAAFFGTSPVSPLPLAKNQ